MNLSSHEFRLVVIENPFQAWDDPMVSHLFHKMVLLKQRGYGEHYVNSVLPVDTTDFIATHVLLCVSDTMGNLKPVMAYKSTTLAASDHYNLVFPGLNLVKQAGAEMHTQVIENIIKSCRDKNRNLAYLSSWTVDHGFKKQYDVKAAFREIFMATYFFLYNEQSVSDVIIGGTLRFGTERVFAQLGHQALQSNNCNLEPIFVRHLAKEPVLVMHADHVPQSLQFTAKKWKSLWDNRCIVQAGNKNKNPSRKAA